MFGLSSTKHVHRNAVLHPGYDVVMMWWLCHLISQWGVGLNTSDLFQWSGLTSIATDLCWVHQKKPCTLWSIVGLRHLPPRMKIQHGLNKKTPFRKTNYLFIEPSEVIAGNLFRTQEIARKTMFCQAPGHSRSNVTPMVESKSSKLNFVLGATTRRKESTFSKLGLRWFNGR